MVRLLDSDAMQTARAPPKAGVFAKRISNFFRDCNNYSIEMVLRKHNFVPIRVSCRRRFLRPHCGGAWAADESCVSLADCRFLRPRCGGAWAADESCVSCRRPLSSSALRRDPWAADESCVSLADDCFLRPRCGGTLGCRRVLCLSCRLSASRRYLGHALCAPMYRYVRSPSGSVSAREIQGSAQQPKVPPQPPTSVQRTSDDSCPAPGRSGRWRAHHSRW